MKVFITDTGETKTLKLVEIGETKNIAKKFIKQHARKIFGKKKVKESGSMEAFGNEGITDACFEEWAAILKTAQSTLLARYDYLSNQYNELHPMVERELKKSYKLHMTEGGFDSKFALKNALDAELAIFDRLAYGLIKVKDPIDASIHPSKGNTSHTLNIKHFRHKTDNIGEEWLMQIYCDFTMVMPERNESFDFTAGIELEFHKVHGGEIEHVDEDDWIFPFSMSFEQESVVVATLRDAAYRNFILLGIDGGISADELGIKAQPCPPFPTLQRPVANQ